METVASSESIAQHTAGPWRVTGEMDRIHGGEVIRPTRGDGIDSPVAVVCDFNRFDRDAEREANARLIAAAPELLGALKQALEDTEDGLHQSPCDEPDCWVERAERAIARAIGLRP